MLELDGHTIPKKCHKFTCYLLLLILPVTFGQKEPASDVALAANVKKFQESKRIILF